MAEKGTTMVLHVVDLQCHRCYKKIKKILCKFPEIRDQTYDVKQNTVTIIVVCCNPEKIHDKLCCKGGKTIKSIEIKEPPKPQPKATQDPKPAAPPPKATQDPKPTPKPDPLACVPGLGIVPFYPVGICCESCSEGRTGGPCFHGCRKPTPTPTPCNDNCGYGPNKCGCGCGGSRGCLERCGCGCGGIKVCLRRCGCGCGGIKVCLRKCGCGCGCGGITGSCLQSCGCGCGGIKCCLRRCGCGCGGFRGCLQRCGCGCGGIRGCNTSQCDYFSDENSLGCTIM